MANPPLENEALLEAESHSVSLGVRLIASVTTIPSDDQHGVIRARTKLDEAASSTIIPFVFDRGDGWTVCGFARFGWALDLYRWAVTERSLSSQQVHRIVGLLHGYAGEEIQHFDARLFSISESCEPIASSRLDDSRHMAETSHPY